APAQSYHRDMRGVVVVVLVAALVAAAAPAAGDDAHAPDAAAQANGVSTKAVFGSGCWTGRDHGICFDTVWPPAGLGSPLPVAPGGAVSVTFTGPVTVNSARVGGQAALFAEVSPTEWRVTVPARLGDGLAAISTLWKSDDAHGDQLYAFALTPAAALVNWRGLRATVD